MSKKFTIPGTVETMMATDWRFGGTMPILICDWLPEGTWFLLANCAECHTACRIYPGDPHPIVIHENADMVCSQNLLILPDQPKDPAMTQPAATPALTKDQASDLKSHVARVVETELSLQKAIATRDRAQDNLNSFVHKLEFPPKQGA